MALTTQQTRTVAYVSQTTGVDPRVVITWILSGGLPWDPYQAAQRVRSLGLTGMQGQNPAQELVHISRATGLSVQGLFTNFERLFGGVQSVNTPYMSPSSAYAVASTVQTGSASDALSFDLTNVPGAVTGAAGAVSSGLGGAFGALTGWVGQLTRWLEGYAIRTAEVVGGFLLVLVGLYLLARQVGLATDAPAVPGAAQLAEAAA